MVYRKSRSEYNVSMVNQKFSIQKAYGLTPAGREYVIWNVIQMVRGTVHVIDSFSLRRDAKFYCGLWNSEAARNGV
jgi:hypothetical protein